MRAAFAFLMVGALATLTHAGDANAQQMEYSRIADLDTPIPDGVGNFTSFQNIVMDAGAVAFIGSGGESQTGVYLHDGNQLSKVLDSMTPIPGTKTPLSGTTPEVQAGFAIRTLDLRDGDVALYTQHVLPSLEETPPAAIYRTREGMLELCTEGVGLVDIPGVGEATFGIVLAELGQIPREQQIAIAGDLVFFQARYGEPPLFPGVPIGVFSCDRGSVTLITRPGSSVASFDTDGETLVYYEFVSLQEPGPARRIDLETGQEDLLGELPATTTLSIDSGFFDAHQPENILISFIPPVVECFLRPEPVMPVPGLSQIDFEAFSELSDFGCLNVLSLSGPHAALGPGENSMPPFCNPLFPPQDCPYIPLIVGNLRGTAEVIVGQHGRPRRETAGRCVPGPRWARWVPARLPSGVPGLHPGCLRCS